jgi:hypothetical protein
LRRDGRRWSKQHYPTEIDLGDKETTKLGCYSLLAMLLFHINTYIYIVCTKNMYVSQEHMIVEEEEEEEEQGDKE